MLLIGLYCEYGKYRAAMLLIGLYCEYGKHRAAMLLIGLYCEYGKHRAAMLLIVCTGKSNIKPFIPLNFNAIKIFSVNCNV